jgi:hypothetical protein
VRERDLFKVEAAGAIAIELLVEIIHRLAQVLGALEGRELLRDPIEHPRDAPLGVFLLHLQLGSGFVAGYGRDEFVEKYLETH